MSTTESAERAALAEMRWLIDRMSTLYFDSVECDPFGEFEKTRDRLKALLAAPSPASTEVQAAFKELKAYLVENFPEDSRHEPALSDLCRKLELAFAPSPAEVPAEPLREALVASQSWLYGHPNVEGQSERRRLNAEVLSAEPNAPSEVPAEPVAWIAPADKVPKGGEVVLCRFRDKGIHTAVFRGTSTTHGVFEAWHGFLTADVTSERVVGWMPLRSPSVPQAVPQGWKLDADKVYARMAEINPRWNAYGSSRDGAVATALAVVAELLAAAPSAKEDTPT